ncbi:hypothetical protein V3481_015263 [Fusarium oxysporum f. sp. vasinfectum]
MLEAVGDLDDTGVWESITVSDPSSNTTVLLQATLYMTSFQAQGMEDNATRTTPRLTEPSLVWDPLCGRPNLDFQRRGHVHERPSHSPGGLLYKVMFYML